MQCKCFKQACEFHEHFLDTGMSLVCFKILLCTVSQICSSHTVDLHCCEKKNLGGKLYECLAEKKWVLLLEYITMGQHMLLFHKVMSGHNKRSGVRKKDTRTYTKCFESIALLRTHALGCIHCSLLSLSYFKFS